MIFTINGKDFSSIVSGLKVGFETLVSDNSGRNAAGNTVLDVINKKTKVYVSFRYMDQEEMAAFMAAISGYVVEVGFKDPKTGGIATIQAYTGTPEPEYYTIQGNHIIYKPMELNFIEL